MLVVRDPREMRHVLGEDGSGRRVPTVLVPTMGALHAGHASLMDRAGEIAGECGGRVVVSIFVNPLQFGDAEDLRSYPSTLDADLDMCLAHGVTAVYSPSVDAVYPAGFATSVSVSGVSERWEGASRAGHFDGVATVVAKLFATCRPDWAIFGRKDLQQVAVVRRMARDLDLGVEVVVAPTVRDSDGLALSSRNTRLSADARRRALVLPEALKLGVDTALERGPQVARAAMAERIRDAAGVSLDYVDLVDDASMEPIERVDGECSAIGALVVDGVRLIDNLPLSPD